jgi:hypothetical protein
MRLPRARLFVPRVVAAAELCATALLLFASTEASSDGVSLSGNS